MILLKIIIYRVLYVLEALKTTMKINYCTPEACQVLLFTHLYTISHVSLPAGGHRTPIGARFVESPIFTVYEKCPPNVSPLAPLPVNIN